MDIDDQAPSHEPTRTASPWALLVFAILFALFFFRALPLELDVVRTTDQPGQFNATRAIERLSRVLDGKPHPIDSDALDATRERLVREIESLGYQPQVHDETACRGSISGSAIRCARVRNITFTAGPTQGSALVLTAHYDSVEASPGFGDDGIGVAVWLEVAHQLKLDPPTKPVLFLITDGEETALLGAQAFVDQKMYGYAIDRIINLEARGVRGPAAMFETSHPNAGVVSDWALAAKRPLSNSMMTAVYELLPNSTDLTVHLQANQAGINLAIADGFDFYHTEHDDLARLDPKSVQHMGDQALGAARSFLVGRTTAPGEIIYSDIATRFFVQLPEMFGLLLLGLCCGAAALLFMRPAKDANWKKADWRALAAPPALIAAAGLFAFASGWFLGLVRPEPIFWVAWPQAFNAVIFIGAMIAAALSAGFIAPSSRREALFASGWLWFLIIGMGLTFAVPGMAIIFLIPGAVFVLAAIIGWLLPRFSLIAHIVAAVVLAVIFLPLIYLVDVMMTLRMAAVFGVLEGLLLAPLLGVIGPLGTARRRVPAFLAATWAIAVVATLLLPAYSAQRPLALNFVAHYDMDGRNAALFASAAPGALPKAVAEQLTPGDASVLPGVTAKLSNRPLDFVDRPAASAAIVEDTVDAEGGRLLTLQLSAPGAQMIRLRIAAHAWPTQFAYNSNTLAMREAQNGYFIVDCNGRACDGARLQFRIVKPKDAEPPSEPAFWIVQGYWLGLPPDAAATANARTDAALRYQMGDVTITTKRQVF
jgi:Peptidase family M28